MTAYDIIIRPIITERAMAGAADKKYVFEVAKTAGKIEIKKACLLYTSPSPRDLRLSRMPSSA